MTETDRQTDKQKEKTTVYFRRSPAPGHERQADRQTDRQRDRQRKKDRVRETERDLDESTVEWCDFVTPKS